MFSVFQLATKTKLLRLPVLFVIGLAFYTSVQAQGVSCPAVVAGPDTTLSCGGCVQLRATPVSGFEPTDYTTQ